MKKLSNLLNAESKKNPHLGFKDGGNFTRHIYDKALVEIFGQKIGIVISNYLINKGIKLPKK